MTPPALPDQLRKYWLRLLTHFLSLTPLAMLVWNYSQNRLTANPIREITLRTGDYSLILLVLSLACTPIANITGVKTVLSLRRLFGLYGAVYAVIHLANFVGMDYRFDFPLLKEDVGGKAYIWVGMAALLLLLPPTATSTKGWIKRLGKNWERLHWLVYPAAVLSVLHYLLLIKGDPCVPEIYGIIVVVLLLFRLRWVKNTLSRLRSKVVKAQG